nr:MAG TPA: DNA circulation protein [Caudoviricetes sp.]
MSAYYENGSFRGVGFEYLSDEYYFQKKTAEDNLFADETDEEELGEMPRAFTIKCCVMGKDARKKRNALQAALEKKDAGILIHPQYGRMKVKVPADGYTIHSSAEQGNYYEFEINFVKANDKMSLTVLPVKPSAAESLKSAVAAAQKVMAESVVPKSWLEELESFADKISMSEIASEMADFTSDVTAKISRLTSLKLLPFDAVTAITGSLTTLGKSAGGVVSYPAGFVSDCLNVFSNVAATFDFYKGLARIKLDILPQKNKYDTPQNKAKEMAQRAIVNVISQVGTVKAVEAAAPDDAGSDLTANEVKERIAEITELVESVVDDADNAESPELQETFEELLQKAVDVLESRATLKTRFISRAVSVPALVLLYEECGRSAVDKLDDFTVRNALKTPLLIGGGQIVEVIDD